MLNINIKRAIFWQLESGSMLRGLLCMDLTKSGLSKILKKKINSETSGDILICDYYNRNWKYVSNFSNDFNTWLKIENYNKNWYFY